MSDLWGLHSAGIDYDPLDDDEPPQDRDDEVDCPSCRQISLLHEVSRNGGHCLYCGVYDHNLDLGRRHGRRSRTDGIRYAHIVEADVADDLMRLAMPAPMPEGITFHHHPTNDTIPTDPFPATRPPHEQVPRFSAPAVEARHNGETVGYLEWDPPLHATVVNGIQYGDHPPEVSMIKVHKDYRRHGIATALFDFARRHQGDLEHSDSRTGLGNLWVDYEQSRKDVLARLAAAVGEDLLGRLHDEFHKWVEDEDIDWELKHPEPDRGPIGDWSLIETFLLDRYRAAHKGHDMGLEEAGHILDGHKPMPYQESGDADTTPYETGPEAVAKYGYDPREIAAGMLLLHNRSHGHRSDMEQGDLDRLSEIARIRSQQQRRTHGRRTAMGRRGPLPDGLTFQYHHDEWEPSVTAHVGDREVGYLSWFAGHPDDYRRELLEGADEGETLASMGISGFGEPVGSAPHDQDLISWPNTVSNVGVDDEWRRRGIALALFDHAKANHNPDLMHSFDLTPDGYEFSQAERGRHRTARAPWNPAGTPLYRGVRIRWSPEEVVRLRDLHDSGEHEALAHAILDRAQHGSTVGEWHRPREDGGLGVFWSGDHGVSRGYGHHGDGHDPDPAGPFENVVVQTDGRHDPDDEWTPYDEDWPHDEEPNDFLNEDRETDLVEGAPVSVTHVHVNAPGGPLSIPLTRPRRMTAMAVLPEGHEGPAEPHYDPDVDVRHWNPDDAVVAPEGRRRTAAAGKDPYDAQREAMAHVGHLRHYIDRGTHPEIGGFDPGPTIAGHPAAHHPILTNHWAAEVVRPPAGGERFGRRVQDATEHYVKALGGMATQGSTGAASELEDAHNGLHVELQHGGHIVVPKLSGFSPLPDPSDVKHLAAINPRLQHGMEFPTDIKRPSTPEEAKALMETLEARAVGYHVNCQRSCLALDARHRGLNVEARPNYWNPVHDRENSDEQWTDEYLASLWEDEKGFPARWIDTDDQFQLSTPSPAHWDAMSDEIAKWGPGGRGLIAMTQRDPTKPPGHPDELFRHVVSAHVDRGGKVSFIDPQIADTAHEWRNRVCYGYYPTGLFTPDHRKKAETDLERMGFGDYDKARARNLLYSPLRYMRIDDKRLTDEAAQHLVNRGTAGPVPILPGGRPEPRPGPSSPGSVFL